jgi:integrase
MPGVGIGGGEAKERVGTWQASRERYATAGRAIASNTLTLISDGERYAWVDLRSISAGDADDWRQGLVDEGKADATISRAVKNARQFMKAAVRKRLASDNPFAELKAGGERNDSRKAFISRETIAKVLDAANTEWQALIALCRYGGLRCPSEVLGLEWEHIDWAGGRFTVMSPKTRKQGKPWRVVPLFPELRPYLEAAQALAPDGARYVIGRYRDTNSNLRTQFKRILRRAAVEPWERLFQNLRASRETELCDTFPLHVVTAWLGNTPTVATQHYLQVTPEHFERAMMGATGGAQVGRQVGLKASEGLGSHSQEMQETSRETPISAILPEVSLCGEYALQDSNL